jgi:bacteriocin biosynthesis cyclodehydratase domain-containing protein
VRPILRPGTHVLRRGRGQVQVGLDPRSALVLPATPAVLDSLRALARPADRDASVDPGTLELLAAHGQLLDERDLMPFLSEQQPSPPVTASLARSAGPATPRVRSARRRSRTSTRTFGHPAGSGLRAQFLSLTAAAGIREAAARRTVPADCGILLGVGEPDRALVDPWTRGGTPYLLVRLTEGRAVIGPFVLPGTTACLRCVDAHCTDADPAWPLLVQQYSSLSARDRPDGAPEPVDPLLAAVALAWAASDVASYVDGARPTTWSATVSLRPGLASLETQEWLRHPACGCSWDPLERSKAGRTTPADACGGYQ